MVKDIFREIKRKWFQFIAIALITLLGVGFYVGIQVTGYDMRITGDAYALQTDVLDYQMRYTLGFDQAMVDEMATLVNGSVSGVVDGDGFVGNDVIQFIEYDSTTENDITLIEGRLPNNPKELVLDQVYASLNDIYLTDDISVNKSEILVSQNFTVVGFVNSNLYMNQERGNSKLGKIDAFAYAINVELKEPVFTAVRFNFEDDVDITSEIAKIKDQEKELMNGRFDRLVQEDRDKLADAQTELNQSIIDVEKEFGLQWSKIESAQRTLDDAYTELDSALNEINEEPLIGSLNEKLIESRKRSEILAENTQAQLNAQYEQIQMIPDEIEKAYLMAAWEAGQTDFINQMARLNAAQDSISNGIVEYQKGVNELESSKVLFKKEKVNAEQKLVDAQVKIDDGYQEIENTSRGTFYHFTREDVIVGYREFYQDSDRIEGIGKVFPLIFFGVAILVTLSTMTRMIDENRIEIGIYKALGYSWFKTTLKYIGFAFFAWIIGASIGLYLGFSLIPNLIYDAYRIMYLTPDLISGFVLSYAVVPLLVSFLASVGIAFFKSSRVAKETTAALLMPASPKVGQRILLERIPFIWNRMSFLYKVSLRNLFRNKTRFFMTVIGIGGTCGLLITGFGLQHSIYSIVDKQFDEIIQYDAVVAFDDTYELNQDDFKYSATLHSDSIKVGTTDVSVYAVDDIHDLEEVLSFRDRKTKQDLFLSDDSVVITEKLSLLYDLGVGDVMTFSLGDQEFNLNITSVTENYLGHYLYLSQANYESVLGYRVDSQLALTQGNSDYDALLNESGVLSVSQLVDIKENLQTMMGNFDIVILVIVGAAFALELIVLLNLISMNISERYKELATLKVLGFYPRELSSYILRENIILTLMSLLVGLFFGKYLHQFVILSAEIDMLMFNRELMVSSYAWAMALTFSLSILINLFMSRKANKINMSDALKS